MSVIIGYVFLGDNGFNTDKYEVQIENLKKDLSKKDSLLNIKDLRIDTLRVQIAEKNEELEIQDTKLNQIKDDTREKINAVNEYNDSDIARYFSERYRNIPGS